MKEGAGGCQGLAPLCSHRNCSKGMLGTGYRAFLGLKVLKSVEKDNFFPPLDIVNADGPE